MSFSPGCYFIYSKNVFPIFHLGTSKLLIFYHPAKNFEIFFPAVSLLHFFNFSQPESYLFS